MLQCTTLATTPGYVANAMKYPTSISDSALFGCLCHKMLQTPSLSGASHKTDSPSGTLPGSMHA